MVVDAVSGQTRTRSTEAPRVDRWAALAAVEEMLSGAERRFGSSGDGVLLDRYALEAVIDLLNSPARVTEFFPELSPRTVCDRVDAGAVRNR
jgi:hypothetical protein